MIIYNNKLIGPTFQFIILFRLLYLQFLRLCIVHTTTRTVNYGTMLVFGRFAFL